MSGRRTEVRPSLDPQGVVRSPKRRNRVDERIRSRSDRIANRSQPGQTSFNKNLWIDKIYGGSKKENNAGKNREESPLTLSLLRETSMLFLDARSQAEAVELHPQAAEAREPSLGFIEFIPMDELVRTDRQPQLGVLHR